MQTENENLTPLPVPETAAPPASETAPTAPEQPAAAEVITAPPATALAPEVATDQPDKPNIVTRFFRAIDRALVGNPNRTGHSLTLAMIVDTAGGQETWLGKADVERLRLWQARYEKNLNFMLNANPTADWLKHQAMVRSRIEAETAGELHALSRSEFERAHLERVEGARLNLEQIYVECFPLCAAIANRVIAIAEERCKSREAQERKEHDHYGVKFDGPSNIVRSFRAAIQYARMRSTFVTSGRAAPRDIIGYINF
jgi:hypothetical protein